MAELFQLKKLNVNFQISLEAFLLFSIIRFSLSVSDVYLLILFQYFA